MRRLAIALLAMTACTGDKLDDAVAKMESLKTRMCTCSDKRCGEDAYADYKRFEHEVIAKQFSEDELEVSDRPRFEQVEGLERDLAECHRKLK